MFKITEEEAKRCAVIKNVGPNKDTIRFMPKKIWYRFQREISDKVYSVVEFEELFNAPNSKTQNN